MILIGQVLLCCNQIIDMANFKDEVIFREVIIIRPDGIDIRDMKYLICYLVRTHTTKVQIPFKKNNSR